MNFNLLLYSVHNRNTKQEVLKEKSNRVCCLRFSDNLKEMIVKYEKGGSFKHFEEVENIEVTDSGIFVTTTAKIWRFDYIF